MPRPAELRVNLTALRSNCQLARSLAPGSKIVAVVKADAYGHGASVIAKNLEPTVDMLAVSCIEEGIMLRNEGINKPILLLEGCFDEEDWKSSALFNFELVVHSANQAERLLNDKSGFPYRIWLKLDTGMHRLGLSADEFRLFYKRIRDASHVENLVLMTHLASADMLTSDFTQMQLDRFNALLKEVSSTDQLSVANSAGLIGWPSTRAHWNRPGIMLYGLSPFSDENPLAEGLKPVMTLESEVIAIRSIDKGESVGYGNTWQANRPSVIATAAIGYGDGYPRNAKSGTPVLVNGNRVHLVGRVSMDLISLDVTDAPKTKIGDKVVLWGEALSANEVAAWADTISYELVTRLTSRVTRIYEE